MSEDLTHMKRDPQAMADLNASPEDYPYGLRLDLTQEDLAKIGLEMPSVGEMVYIQAMTKVASVHASDHADGGQHAGVCLQITHMKAEIEDTEGEDDEPKDARTPAQKIYGKK